MMPVLFDDGFLRHLTGEHPERPERLIRIIGHLKAPPANQHAKLVPCHPVEANRLFAVHDPKYVSDVESLCQAGGGWLDADTRVSPESAAAARMACGAVCQGIDMVMSGAERGAFCAVRPPGHHALSQTAMGFCLFNSIAVGAQYAVSELGLSRVLIVDWDVHHGNGSQDIFWRRSDVAFMSIHRYPFYPGTGSSEETGAGAGLGWTLNLPIEYGTSRAAYLDAFRNGIERFASQAKPELILISAGFDAYWQDPIGSLGLQPEDFAEMTAIVLEISRAYCPGKVVSVLEGGYHLVGLADCVAAHLATWAMRE